MKFDVTVLRIFVICC